MNNDIRVIFPVEQYKKWRAYIEAVNVEISGLGKILQVQPNIFIVTEIEIIRQVVTGSHTFIGEEAYSVFCDEKMQQGEKMSEWKLWWHSHAFIDAYFSSIDNNTIEDWDNLSDKHNWLLSIVSNKRAETKIRLDVFKPVRLTIEDIPFEISYADYEMEQEVALEVAEKIELFKPKAPIRKSQSDTWMPRSQQHPLLPAQAANTPVTLVMPDGREIPIDKG